MWLLSCGLLSAANSCGVGVVSYVLWLVVASAWCAVFGYCVWPVLGIVGLGGGLLFGSSGCFLLWPCGWGEEVSAVRAHVPWFWCCCCPFFF